MTFVFASKIVPNAQRRILGSKAKFASWALEGVDGELCPCKPANGGVISCGRLSKDFKRTSPGRRSGIIGEVSGTIREQPWKFHGKLGKMLGISHLFSIFLWFVHNFPRNLSGLLAFVTISAWLLLRLVLLRPRRPSLLLLLLPLP